MRSIQIGIEVHKAIEAERRSLTEPENLILMRLLKLKSQERAEPELPAATARSWIKDGVELPEATRLQVDYSGQHLDGVVRDGRWIVGGQAYLSPSMALIHNVTTREGRRTNLNGWNHWMVKRPGDPGF